MNCFPNHVDSDLNRVKIHNGTPHDQVRPPSIAAKFAFLFSPTSHVVRTFAGGDYETIEISGPQMVLTMKLTTFAWNVWDGRRPSEVRLVCSSLPSMFELAFQDLDKWQTEQRVVEFPSLIEFLGYA